MVNLASDLNMHGLTQAPATGGGTGGSGVIEFNGKRYEPQYAMKLVNRPHPIAASISNNLFTDNFTISVVPNGNADSNMNQDIVVYDLNNSVISRTQSSTNYSFVNGVLFATRGGGGTANEEYVFIDPENDIHIVKKRTDISPSSSTAGRENVISFNGKIGVLWNDRKLHILDNDGQYLGVIDLVALISLIPGAPANATFTLESNGVLVDGDDLYLLFKNNSYHNYFMKFDISGVLPSFTQGYFYTTFANLFCKGIKREGIFVYVVYSTSNTGQAYSIVLRASDLVTASALATVKSLPYTYASVGANNQYSNGAIYFTVTTRTITINNVGYPLYTAVMLTISVDNTGTPYVKDFDVDTGYDYLFFGNVPFAQAGSYYFKSTKAMSWFGEGALLHSLEPTFIGYKEVTI
ncbi:hypothetical protein [Lysinibacillus capsici]|uniref:hypothetical protein n=1 Tax=Lysinibacillus capsici TaxID=2115968 RepID=UPI000E1FFF45|nr:hypothetical protein [Lysinibacillus capsici]RDV27114.1 hypothetical protein C7B89_19955 [Lysinibacillus capsici]